MMYCDNFIVDRDNIHDRSKDNEKYENLSSRLIKVFKYSQPFSSYKKLKSCHILAYDRFLFINYYFLHYYFFKPDKICENNRSDTSLWWEANKLGLCFTPNKENVIKDKHMCYKDQKIIKVI